MQRIFFSGAGYDDSTAGHEKQDDAVSPGGYYEYVWDINPKDGPTINDPDCLTYSYSSQVDPVRDMNSGLIGALLICKSSQCLKGQRTDYDDCGHRFLFLRRIFTGHSVLQTGFMEVGECCHFITASENICFWVAVK